MYQVLTEMEYDFQSVETACGQLRQVLMIAQD